MPTEDAAWMTEHEISKYDVQPKDLMENYFLPQEYDAGASSPLSIQLKRPVHRLSQLAM